VTEHAASTPEKSAMTIVINSQNSINHQRAGVIRSKYNGGFTLIELLLVLFIAILGLAAIGISISSGNDATAHKAVARDLVSALRFAKGQALMFHKEATVELDLNENTYTVSDRDKVYDIPETIDLTVVTAQEEMAGNGFASIRFFPDGSSTGGRITLHRGSDSWQIDINWLTGQIELEQK
jgi:general secretion pathway protein H